MSDILEEYRQKKVVKLCQEVRELCAESSFAAPDGSLASIPHKCPVCDGAGLVSRPPGVAGDVQTWSSMDAAHTCLPCNGQGIIWSKPGNAAMSDCAGGKLKS